ncbi:MAG: hypothetical protein F4Z75_00660 [Synechococcus sp. SB0668_bin_15]|nr:hypothetical protein [Synechococcus sp. SB0668_bin_15]MXZ82278.1 hypothetical protein [Synechococcus sp. SB0666_bin_14]MYA91145.1 hypothetical protein [Synechococcus sp. SB0663_bin_10]MYC48929.1 hypothetical protein [Synechococcus sp. SB0662_bin_14]MYG46814.1 hypothetical protein [Synechococcus sp. SB0675_bin_6]MYJ59064.1 hypothetical protein [Synechococcus sp. SB0672_bin_6]MYK90700.1 hypothetical protein [Synechococcus sp. SB0669_bin_8]
MIHRLLLLGSGWGVGLLMLLSLSLGAQNLERSSERLSLDLGFGHNTVPLPSGVIIGLGLIAGLVAGSSASALVWPRPSSAEEEGE